MKAPIDHRAYWRTNLRYVGILLTIWAAVSFGCGILFVDVLDRHRLPGTGFKLGFWFAQQGSIYVFVLLIVVYVVLMRRLDARAEADRTDREPRARAVAPAAATDVGAGDPGAPAAPDAPADPDAPDPAPADPDPAPDAPDISGPRR